MRKNPGRKERRRIAKQNRTELSGKKQAINERIMRRLSKIMKKGRKKKED